MAENHDPISVRTLVEKIHAAPVLAVLALTGGGSRAVAELLEVPGGSRTLLEAVVPYSEPSMLALLGAKPERFSSSPTARAMAVAAFERARRYGAADKRAVGVACAAGLVTDRPRKGSDAIHVAVQTSSRTAAWSIELTKNRRSRPEEEEIAVRMALNALAYAGGLAERLPLELVGDESALFSETIATQEWEDLFLGKSEAICVLPQQALPCDQNEAESAKVILSGAFNPLHNGHRHMMAMAAEIMELPVAVEISIINADKPMLDYAEIECRVKQFGPEMSVWLTRAATFEEKSRLFPGATFVVGVDTLRRIADPKYYGGDPLAMLKSIERLLARGCLFLVFGRLVDSGFVRLVDLELPSCLREACREIPPELFREDISSTAIRNAQST
jgi:nicotinic acid mononucleotide adenylyltransferase/nicotinamide mononucleotide (NMN) deamidase PncC